MNQRELASVLFAVVGVFVAATRLPELFFHVGLLAGSDSAVESPTAGPSQRYLATLVLGASLATILVGSGLVLLRQRLADRLFAAGTQPLDAREAQAVAISVLGCYLAVQGISRIGWAGRWLAWSAAVQLALGIALFFGARGLSGLWLLSRSAGRSRSATETSF